MRCTSCTVSVLSHGVRTALAIFVVALFAPGGVLSQEPPDSLIHHALRVSLAHLESSVREVGDTTRYPSYAPHNLRWSDSPSNFWTSGFYPGCLWLAYELSGNDEFKRWAGQWTAGLAKEAFDTNTHDLGFMIGCSFGNGIRNLPDAEAREYRRVMLDAAITLDRRYSPKVGLLRCYWDVPPFSEDTTLYPVVVDIMMNLELLFWGAEHGGPASLRDHAIHHAMTTYRDFLRPDGGSYHVVRYKKESGAIYNRGTIQGQNDSSTWTRGHAWFTYGMTVCYRYTRDQGFLTKACTLADYFLKRLTPDNVSTWDFDAGPESRTIKDASATAIFCSALFELSTYVNDPARRERYREKAVAMLVALCSPRYLAEQEHTNVILLHSTQFLTQPGNQNTDKPAIFADYYFLEAIKRYLRLEKGDLK